MSRRFNAIQIHSSDPERILLHLIQAQDQEHRTFRLDRILGARITNRTFTPRYAVELTPTGPLVAPEAASRVSSSWAVPARRARTASGPVNVFRCSVCNKRFEHKNYDATLRAHKNQGGGNCYGRHGIFEGRK